MEQLTLFGEDFPANPSVSPGNDAARWMTVTSGRKWLALFPRSDRIGSLEKTLLGSPIWRSTTFFLTWKALTTPAGRLLYRLAPSAHPTGETECSLWPTPHANCHTGAGKRGEGGPNLQTAVRMWPTPSTREYKGGRKFETLKAKGRGITNTLNDAVNHTVGKTAPLNPEWVEALQGFPIGWTEPDGQPLLENHSMIGNRQGSQVGSKTESHD